MELSRLIAPANRVCRRNTREVELVVRRSLIPLVSRKAPASAKDRGQALLSGVEKRPMGPENTAVAHQMYRSKFAIQQTDVALNIASSRWKNGIQYINQLKRASAREERRPKEAG